MTDQQSGSMWTANFAARIEEILRGYGVAETTASWLTQGLMLAALLAAVAVTHLVFRPLVARGLMALSARTRIEWDDALAENGVFRRMSHLLPALILGLLGPLLFRGYPSLQEAVDRILLAYLAIVGALIVGALLSALIQIYRRSFASARQRPILAYIQVVEIFVWIAALILAVAALLGESPWAFLGGLGALTAILMLVFKDAILGLVASIQLSANDMVRVGDWIEIPAMGLDGEVIELSLTTVKVRNWDKAVSSLPSHKLITEMFKNWRGMTESGVRRIKRRVPIDVNSIRILDDGLRADLGRLDHVGDYLRDNQGEELTNIGVFRAYVLAYLEAHPMIDESSTLLVQQLDPTEKGAPIQLYVFSREQRLAQFEVIQAEIVDHVVAMAPRFGLKLFQLRTN